MIRHPQRPSARSGVPPTRIVVALIIAAAVLIVFIGLLGDLRRKRNALEQLEQYTALLLARTGPTDLLPLNLAPDPLLSLDGGLIRMEWLSREEAGWLRNASQAVIAARTTPIPAAILPRGRAVVFFHQGRFTVRWCALAEFNRLLGEQDAYLRTAGETKAKNDSSP